MQELTKEEKLKAAEQLAAHLSALRKAAGLTQEEFGARAGLSRRRISLIESGGYKPSWQQFMSFIAVFLVNKPSFHYIMSHNLFPEKIISYLQGKSVNCDPDFFGRITHLDR